MTIMATGTADVIAPIAITLPSIPYAKQALSAPTGALGMSGAFLVFFNGTIWKYAAGT